MRQLCASRGEAERDAIRCRQEHFRLEQRLGVALFQRTTRRQALTEEGEVFYLQSRRALDNLRDAENEIQRGKPGARAAAN